MGFQEERHDEGGGMNAFIAEGDEGKMEAVQEDSKKSDGKEMEAFLDQPVKPKELDAAPQREKWNRDLEFVLAAVGNAVGLGNLWRFPYLCYESGGGAFLIPYFIMLLVCGIPLLYMEIAVGQFTQRGPIGALQKLCPIFMGAGMATVMLSFLFVTYYNVIVSWAMYYLLASCQAVLPWSHCNNTWNSDKCWDQYAYWSNETAVKPNDTTSPSQEFYENQVLKKSSGIEEQGGIVWELAILLIVAWAVVYLCIWKGVRWTGKVVYFTATFPYLVIFVLLVRGLTLPGSEDGVDFFINPKWELLKEPTVWVNAAAQNFNSISIAFGSMITYGSYNSRNNRIFKNVLSICLLNSFTSILAGFTVFSILGNIAYKQGMGVEDVVTDGPGLVFMVYPEAFTTMPFGVGQFLAFLFFFMLICLAIDSQFASVEVVVTTLEDHFGKTLLRYLKRREILVLVVCIVACVCGLPNITRGGIYFFQIIDKYSCGLSLMLIALIECIAITWCYGAKRLADNIKYMTGGAPNIYFVICWFVLSPLLILGIMIFNWINYSSVTYGDYVYPSWADGLGWFLASLSLVCIPIGAVRGILDSSGKSMLKRILNSFKAQDSLQVELELEKSASLLQVPTMEAAV